MSSAMENRAPTRISKGWIETYATKGVPMIKGAALIFVNSLDGEQLHLRGINTRVVQAGEIRVGDGVRKV